MQRHGEITNSASLPFFCRIRFRIPALSHSRSIRFLLQRGVNVNHQDDMGWTALHWAAFTDHADTASLLVQNGADNSIENIAQQTPLDEVQMRFETVPTLRTFLDQLRADQSIDVMNIFYRSLPVFPETGVDNADTTLTDLFSRSLPSGEDIEDSELQFIIRACDTGSAQARMQNLLVVCQIGDL
jgi:hypothetical protein